MKKFVIRNIQVVGMHHYGRRELDRLGSYIVDIEANNSYDPTAVAVYDGQRKVGSRKRDGGKAIHEVITANKSKSKYFLRLIEEPTWPKVLSRRVVPQQTCAIVFKILKTDIEWITQMVNKHSIIYAKVMELPSKRST